MARGEAMAGGRKPTRAFLLVLGALVALAAAVAPPRAAAAAAPPPAAERAGVAGLLTALPDEYRAADPAHESAAAARARAMAAALLTQVDRWQAAGGAGLAAPHRDAARLVAALATSRDRLHPWALPMRVEALAGQLGADLHRAGYGGAVGARPYAAIESLLDAAQAALTARDAPGAAAAAAEAYGLFAAGPAPRLRNVNAALTSAVSDAFWAPGPAGPGLLPALAGRRFDAAAAARDRAGSEIGAAAIALGDQSISKATVVADAAVIVFREGLEAVLILAAITASFVGARRRLRRPVLIGAALGLGATALTYMVAQALVDALGDGGLRLQAITGVLAIVVLLIVTNWFFHRVYWSEWIGRFNRRRKALERIDKLGFISGQVAGFVLLGLTSVYREGFETVLFLQNLQVSAGTHATVLGVGIGLAGTLLVGFVTFSMERKLPYKKMLILTGILIGLVLAMMVGTTVHSLQGLAWVPTTPTQFRLDLWWGQWLGIYATWEGIGAQLAALLVVYGSYAAARQLQARRRRLAARDGAARAVA